MDDLGEVIHGPTVVGMEIEQRRRLEAAPTLFDVCAHDPRWCCSECAQRPGGG